MLLSRRDNYPIAQQPGYLSGAPRFPGHRVAIGQFGAHILDNGTLTGFQASFSVSEQNISDLFELLPEILPCGVSREEIRYCVMSDIPILSLYASTDLTYRELEQELKKAWKWSRRYAFWWGDDH